MPQHYKPEGYTSVAVYIMADGAQRVIEFLKQTFNADMTSPTAPSCMLRCESTIRLSCWQTPETTFQGSPSGSTSTCRMWMRPTNAHWRLVACPCKRHSNRAIQIVAAASKIRRATPGGSRPRSVPDALRSAPWQESGWHLRRCRDVPYESCLGHDSMLRAGVLNGE